ncbi:Diguanylate Cyclase and Two-component system sensory domain-containing protein [Halorubrum xinjiangense]|uniref:Diguanylate Cyclase and Two-component system sensory domain-containing protein n=1 Tax=Halorubrum xinjiangense TaxID=261291 RepID=A0A1G7GZQ3_9EURY|nr:DICT sensory domain-containing protein [Halorubrum xinjiangense]SDE93638.1 Diguanylate Cyclase and Two-component system sensory domain-containing protein [Halorubrum xinjiangense]
MSLIELIAGVEAHEATLTVFNADPAVTEELREYFADRNVRIVDDQTASGPEEFAVLARDGEFVTAVTVDDLLPGREGDGSGETDGDGTAGGVGRPVLDHLDETMFTSYSREDMVAASREIEDRAWRVGDGELHAGFQTLDVLTGEADTYDLLGEKERLDVHAYAADEGESPDIEHYTVHVGETAEIRETWFVAYDGGGYEDAKCALLAEERAPGEFYGFWSYDPETVDYIIDYLTERYGGSEQTDDGGATV